MTMILTGSGTGTVGVPNSGTAQNSTSGTSIDFTGIPAGTKRITVMFNGVSTNGTSHALVQIGSGSVSATGYNSTGAYTQASTGTTSATSGFVIYSDNATFTRSGTMVICLISSNSWVSNHTLKCSTGQLAFGGGDVALSGTLDRVRVTTVNGTDTFDAGSINILYE